MDIFEQKLIDNLVQKKLVTSEQKQQILQRAKQQGVLVENALVKEAHVSQEGILKAKSEIAQVGAYSLEGSQIPKEVLNFIPVETVQQYKMVPIIKNDNQLIVGMVDPTSIKARDALRFIFFRSNVQTEIVAITEQDFQNILVAYRELGKEVSSALEEIEQSAAQTQQDQKQKWQLQESEGEDNKMLRSAPIVRVVAVILRHAIEGNASDIHIESSRENTRVRFRLDGTLHTSLVLPLNVHTAIVARIKILASLRLDESRIPQDGRFSTTLKGNSIDFRVSTFPTNTGEKVVLRVLKSTNLLTSFDKLGMADYQYKILEKVLELPYGMILVSGPTGSGKSTTLYAALNVINKEDINIVSLEDPVEYYMPGVNQSQTRADIGYTFATGLRHILRQDPDVILVGEIRDNETASLAVQASLTGHLLFSSIHTNNAIGVVPRLLDMGIDAFLLPSSLSVVIAQRLLGRLCERCKTKVKATPSVEQMITQALQEVPQDIKNQLKIVPPYYLHQAHGCAECRNTKVKGRIAVYELLQVTDELKSIILEDPNDLNIEQEAQRQGMITMKQDGVIKALQGVVALEEVLQKTED